jgi:hypothetical protein
MNAARASNPILDDGTCISEKLIGRLHHATEDRVLDIWVRSKPRSEPALRCIAIANLICAVSASPLPPPAI